MNNSYNEWMEREKFEHDIAKHYHESKGGQRNLEWMMDTYWGLVTKDIILPTSLAIYDALVKKGYDEKNHYNISGDNHLYYIPTKGKTKGTVKVFVYSSQSRDFMFLINYLYDKPNLHIRRIWREFDYQDNWDAEQISKSDNPIREALWRAESLSEYSDEGKNDGVYFYTSRPSLESYRKVDFRIPYDAPRPDSEGHYHNSFSDNFTAAGYVLSFTEHVIPLLNRVEGTKYSFADIDYIRGAMGWMADSLDLIDIA